MLTDKVRLIRSWWGPLFSSRSDKFADRDTRIGVEDTQGTIFAQMLIGASLAFCPEGTAVKHLSTDFLSPIEKEVIAEIRALRASPGSGFPAPLLGNPARIVHHVILASHGNVQLRLSTVARELGVEMRTLERAFAGEYNRTMVQYQVEVRLSFSRWMLSIFPPVKIGAIATILGYDRVQDFNRYFKKHTHESPSEWSRKERARIAAEEQRTSHD